MRKILSLTLTFSHFLGRPGRGWGVAWLVGIRRKRKKSFPTEVVPDLVVVCSEKRLFEVGLGPGDHKFCRS